MLQVVERGKVEHVKPDVRFRKTPTAKEALEAVAILSGLVVGAGGLSERIAMRVIELFVRSQMEDEAA